MGATQFNGADADSADAATDARRRGMDAANFAKRNQKFGKVRPVKFANHGPKFRKE